jgi:hypothetical protein
MMRAAQLATLIIFVALRSAAAADPFHFEDLRIAAPGAGSRGLEAMLLRPPAPAAIRSP